MWDNTWGINGFFLSAQKQPDEDFNQQKHWGLNQQKIVCKGLQGYHKSIARMSPTRIIVSDVGLTNTSKRNVNQLNYYI